MPIQAVNQSTEPHPPLDWIQSMGSSVVYIQAKAAHTVLESLTGYIAEKIGRADSFPLRGWVIDVENNSALSIDELREVQRTVLDLIGRQRIFFLGCPSQLAVNLQNESDVTVCSSLSEVFTTLSPKKPGLKIAKNPTVARTPLDPKLDTLVDGAFKTGLVETMKIQCSTHFSPEKPFVREAGFQPNYAVAALMGMHSRVFTGSVLLGFEEATFLGLMSRMFGETMSELTAEIEDGCGEMLNIVYGQTRKILSESDFSFGKTIPRVVVGVAASRLLVPQPSRVLPFNSDLGRLWIEVGYRRA